MDDFFDEDNEPVNISVQPHSRPAEEAVLGALLIDPDAIKRIDLDEDDFYVARNKFVFAAMKAVKVVDFLTVIAKLEERNQIDEVGGSGYLMGLLNNTPTSMHASVYAEIVRGAAKRRKAICLANEIATLAYSGKDFDSKFSEMGTKFYALNKEKDGQSEHIKSALSRLYDRIEKAAANPRDIWGMETGIRGWDKILGGHHKGEMILLSGDPGVGKSIFTTDIAFGLAKNGHPGTIIEMEMEDLQVLNRKLSGFIGVEANRMKSGRLQEGDWLKITNGIAEMEALPVCMTDKPSWSISGMRADLMRLREEHDIEWVVIDYLDYIKDHKDLKRHDRLGENARSLKIMCRELDVNMMVINSMNKEGERNPDPTTADQSGSASVGFDTDLSVFMKMNKKMSDKDKTIVDVTFSKNREGDANRIVRLVKIPGIPSFKELQLP